MRTTRGTIHDETPISRIERDPTGRRSGGRNVHEQTLSTANTAAAAHFTQTDFLIIAAFSAPIVWLLGAVMMLKRWSVGYFLVGTFLFGMMFAELSHFVSPFMEGRYIPLLTRNVYGDSSRDFRLACVSDRAAGDQKES
jgi:hypothetical protein